MVEWEVGLDLGCAAVDVELDAVDVAGVVGGEEEGDGGDFFGAAYLAAGNQGCEVGLGVGAEGIEDGCVDGSGAEDVDADLAVLEVVEPGAGEGADRRFAGSVHAEGRKALDAGDGAVEEDGAAVVEEGQGLSGRWKRVPRTLRIRRWCRSALR